MSDFLKNVEKALRAVNPISSASARYTAAKVKKKKQASDLEKEVEKYLAEYGESFKERTRADALEFQKMQKEGTIPLDVRFNPQGRTMHDYEDLWSDSYKRTRELGRRKSAALYSKLKQLGHPDFDGTNERERRLEEAAKDPLDPLVQEERLREAERAKRIRDHAEQQKKNMAKAADFTMRQPFAEARKVEASPAPQPPNKRALLKKAKRDKDRKKQRGKK